MAASLYSMTVIHTLYSHDDHLSLKSPKAQSLLECLPGDIRTRDWFPALERWRIRERRRWVEERKRISFWESTLLCPMWSCHGNFYVTETCFMHKIWMSVSSWWNFLQTTMWKKCIKHKWILCLDLGSVPMLSHKYANFPNSYNT